jgi:hypothetical protein
MCMASECKYIFVDKTILPFVGQFAPTLLLLSTSFLGHFLTYESSVGWCYHLQANQREKLQREEDTGGSQKLASNENYRAEP